MIFKEGLVYANYILLVLAILKLPITRCLLFPSHGLALGVFFQTTKLERYEEYCLTEDEIPLFVTDFQKFSIFESLTECIITVLHLREVRIVFSGVSGGMCPHAQFKHLPHNKNFACGNGGSGWVFLE